MLALALDSGNRRVYFHAGWIGGLIGAPAFLSDYLLKHGQSDDWLVRSDFFLPIGRFDDLVLPNDLPLFLLLGLLVLARRRELTFVWALGSAGLLLENQQLATRLQLDNYHWAYVWGPAFCYLSLLFASTIIEVRKGWSTIVCVAIGAVAASAYSAGLWIRAVQATRTADSIANARVIAAYRSEFRPGIAPRFIPNAVVAGDTDFTAFAAIMSDLRPLYGWTSYYSSWVTDAELDDRAALNDLLLGFDRPSFEARQHSYFNGLHTGPVERNRSLVSARIAARLDAYDRARADLPVVLNRFAVLYVSLPAGSKPLYLGRGWTLISGGHTWDVWERITNP